MQKDSHKHEAVVKVQGDKIRNGRKGDKRFEGQGGAGVLD